MNAGGGLRRRWRERQPGGQREFRGPPHAYHPRVATLVANQVFADGSTLADLIAQAAQVPGPPSFSSAVTQLTNRLKDAGVITGLEKGRDRERGRQKPGT